MTLHADCLDVLTGWVAPSAEQESLRAEFVAHLRARPDGIWRSCTPDHLTGSLLVTSPDADRVLLTLHARVGRWLQFGGHLEPRDGRLVEAALREGREESGLHDLALVAGGPLLLDAHPAPCATPGAQRHLDAQWAAVIDPGAAPHVSEESLDVRWFAADALPADTDASVRRLVAAARGRLGAAQPSSAEPTPARSSSDSPRLPAVENPSR